MNINQIDLNLLKAFDALYFERNVSRAGERIGIAQPSMSNALNRLRALFDDPLFQRMPEGMMPTRRAEELAPKVHQMLELVGDMWIEQVFDPYTATDHIKIAAADLTIMTMAPKLMTFLEKNAPNLQISWASLDKSNCFAQLDEGEIDFVIGTFGSMPSRFHRKTVHKDHFICIVGADHSRLDGTLSFDDYINQRHVLVTLRRDLAGVVDAELKKLKKERQVAMTCAQFSPVPDIVANTDMIATIPVSFSEKAIRAGCRVFPVPLDLPSWEMELVWTQKTQALPLGKFMVEAFLLDATE